MKPKFDKGIQANHLYADGPLHSVFFDAMYIES